MDTAQLATDATIAPAVYPKDGLPNRLENKAKPALLCPAKICSVPLSLTETGVSPALRDGSWVQLRWNCSSHRRCMRLSLCNGALRDVDQRNASLYRLFERRTRENFFVRVHRIEKKTIKEIGVVAGKIATL